MIFRNDRDRRTPVARATDRLYPLLPLRDIIVFPHMMVPLFVGREKSINALDDAMNFFQWDRVAMVLFAIFCVVVIAEITVTQIRKKII